MRKRGELATPSHRRTWIAIVLMLGSILFTITFTSFSQRGEKYWVASAPILPGSQIGSDQLHLERLNLGPSRGNYFSEGEDPSMLLAKRFFAEAEPISRAGVTEGAGGSLSVLVPLSIRSFDIPADAREGDVVSLYWVLDSRTEELFEPEEIGDDVYIKSIDRKGSNFGTDLAVTVSIAQSQVQKMLSYTSGGRIVVVPQHG